MKTKIRQKTGPVCRWNLLPTLLLLLGLTNSAFSQPSPPATGRRTLRGHMPPVVSSLTPIERLAGTNRLRLAIGLPLRDKAGLTNLLHDLYDPASPRYRQYLTVEQFTERHGPAPADYETLTAFARTNGLTVRRTHANRLLLDVEGSVADIERTFGVQMHTYQHPHENRKFFAPDREPSVPAGVPVLDIEGLNNYQLPHHAGSSTKVIPAKFAAHVTGGASTAGGSGATNAEWSGSGRYGCFMAADIRAAYAPGVTLTGAGQTVGIVSIDGFYQNDILSYEQQNNLPNVPVIPVLIDGVEGKVGSSGINGAEVEFPMDIEMAIAMAPGLSQVLVYEVTAPVASYGFQYNLVNDLLNRIATGNIAKQISTSVIWWGGSREWGLGYDSTTDQIFQQMAVQGQSFFCASGDWGANMVGPSYSPDPVYHYDAPLMTSPYITIVGGTTLNTAGPGGPWQAETTWSVPNVSTNGILGTSGGNISASYAIPIQKRINNAT
jgi:subtilase family serine protease